MSVSAKDDLYLAWLRGKSRMKRVGWFLLVTGTLIGAFGWFLTLMELTTEAGHLGLAAFIAFVGTALGNLGFCLVMFGLIEDRILQSEAVVLAEIKERPPTNGEVEQGTVRAH